MIKGKKIVIAYPKYLLFFAVTLTLSLFAQNESNIWYFGENAGIDFNGSSPVPLVGESVGNEGCATVSDVNGNLLFYTNGVAVWNNNHDTMPNGFGLLGNSSSSQTVVIVPKPNSDSIYYIFTTAAAENSGRDGLRYSEVNLSLDGGKGDITSIKNVLLIAPSTERLGVTGHCNDRDLWVIGQRTTGSFYAYLVTPDGVNLNPSISDVGIGSEILGGLRISPNGKQMAATAAGFGGNPGAWLYDFDNATGIVSNALKIESGGSYGVEFSPSGEILYVASHTSITQFDLLATNIVATGNVVFTRGPTNSIGFIQLAPDGKIYVARGLANYLSVINNPNVLGTGCNTANVGLTLALGTQSMLGLPQRIIKTGDLNVTVNSVGPFCTNDESVNLTANGLNGIWSGSGIVDSIMGTFNPSEAGPGDHEITYTVLGGCFYTITITVNLSPIAEFGYSPNVITTLDPEVDFEDLSVVDSVNTWSWIFGELGSSTEQHPVFIFPDHSESYQIELIITDINNCSDTVKKEISIKESAVFISNSFTPNGDGINDFFEPMGIGIKEESYYFSVFNRWGEKVYENNQLGKKWDGTFKGEAAPEGVYIWKVNYIQKGDTVEKTETGKITLIK